MPFYLPPIYLAVNYLYTISQHSSCWNKTIQNIPSLNFLNGQLLPNLDKITYGLYVCISWGITCLQLTQRLGINTSLWQVLFLESAIILFLSIIISSGKL